MDTEQSAQTNQPVTEGTDIFPKEKRSQVMSRIRSRNTKPEMLVRTALHQKGYRFRLHKKDLPGKPDLVLPKHKTAVFIHGCFWHQHQGCKGASLPKQNAEYWQAKFKLNKERDRIVKQKLTDLGWRVIEIWECEVKRHGSKQKSNTFLEWVEQRVFPHQQNLDQ